MQPVNGNPDDRSGTSTSRSLLGRLHTNDPAAWDRLVGLYAPLVWSWCRKMNLAHQDMADVLQEVFKAVALHVETFHKDRPSDTFRGWLRTITRNKVHDHFRRLQKEPAGAGGTEAQWQWSQVPDPEKAGAEEAAPADDHELLHRALAMIQPEFEVRTWHAFWKVVVDGRSPREVAEELHTSQGAVRVAKCRVLQRLRQVLGDVQS